MTSLPDDDLISEDHISVSSTNEPPTSIIVEYLSSIFEDDMIEKFSDKDGNKRRLCKWCGTSFAGWHATTKAIAHVNKLTKSDIKPCKVVIDEDHTTRYQSLLSSTKKKRVCQSLTNTALSFKIF